MTALGGAALAPAAARRGWMSSTTDLRGKVVHTDPTHQEHHHSKPRHLAERYEAWVGFVMVAVIVVLAVGLVFGVMPTGNADPSWMR